MKNLRQLFAAVVLTLLLSISTLAGDGIILPWVTPPPPLPPPPSATTGNASATEGIILTGCASADSATVAAMNLLQSVLTLF